MRGARFFALGLVALSACKDPETAARQEQRDTGALALERGEAALDAGNSLQAVAAFIEATQIFPADPRGYRRLAAAHAQQGNPAAAILALRHAMDLAGAHPELSLTRELIALYLQSHRPREEETLLSRLEPSGVLSEEELLELVRLRAGRGDLPGARDIAAHVLALYPQSPAGRVAEAEVELAGGHEMEAARHLDALLKEAPTYVPARLLRVRYFLRNGYPELAIEDLGALPDALMGREEVVLLQAQGLSQLHHDDDAKKSLDALVAVRPRDAIALAALARVELALTQLEESQTHVERALAVDPDCAPALAVRGWLAKAQGNDAEARQNFEDALRADSSSALAVRGLWPLAAKSEDLQRAIELLEGLTSGEEGEDADRLALAGLYVQTHSRPDRASALVNALLRREPGNAAALALRKKLGKPRAKAPRGIVIMRGGH